MTDQSRDHKEVRRKKVGNGCAVAKMRNQPHIEMPPRYWDFSITITCFENWEGGEGGEGGGWINGKEEGGGWLTELEGRFCFAFAIWRDMMGRRKNNSIIRVMYIQYSCYKN